MEIRPQYTGQKKVNRRPTVIVMYKMLLRKPRGQLKFMLYTDSMHLQSDKTNYDCVGMIEQ